MNLQIRYVIDPSRSTVHLLTVSSSVIWDSGTKPLVTQKNKTFFLLVTYHVYYS